MMEMMILSGISDYILLGSVKAWYPAGLWDNTRWYISGFYGKFWSFQPHSSSVSD